MECNDIRYPIGVQSFQNLRQDGYVYIDKTGYFRDLFRNKYYFLSRPRRFGKSLLLSTLEAYFRGKKELFDGLAVSQWEKDWIEYPVVHVDFNTCHDSDITLILRKVRSMLLDIAETYALRQSLLEAVEGQSDDVSYVFERLLYLLNQKYGLPVVVLIDEYDKGLLDNSSDEEVLANATRALRPFFNVLKSSDQHIKFAFVTGVTRFRNTTLFSGINNLKDISLDERYASLLGISQQELEQSFSAGIVALGAKYDWDRETALKILRDHYDGYRFTAAEEYLYNPFSLLNALESSQLRDYWVMTGSSMALENKLKYVDFRIDELTNNWIDASRLEASYKGDDLASLLFQTGYLTIAEYNGWSLYKLCIPNIEVQAALSQIVLPRFVREYSGSGSLWTVDRHAMMSALAKGDVDGMMQTLKRILAQVPYQEIDAGNLEKHYHLSLYLIFMMLGSDARCEVSTAMGRSDMVVLTPSHVYVFEFKLGRSARKGLEQIKEKDYALTWEAKGRSVVKIAVTFSAKKRNISSWKIET